MTEQRKADLLKGWESLTAKGKSRLLEFLEMVLVSEKPGFQEWANAKDEAYRVQMAKVRDLKSRLEKVSMDTRGALLASLPAGKLHDLLITQELLLFLVYAAEYKPFYLFEEGGKALRLAERTIRDVTRRLAKIGQMQA
jgi:hypothetical protein